MYIHLEREIMMREKCDNEKNSVEWRKKMLRFEIPLLIKIMRIKREFFLLIKYKL